jgi:hypothetical protein
MPPAGGSLYAHGPHYCNGLRDKELVGDLCRAVNRWLLTIRCIIGIEWQGVPQQVA